MSWNRTETYKLDDPCLEPELAQELFDTGLLSSVNAVLHPHGLAIGVVTDDLDPRRVVGVSLHESADPDGIWFDEATTIVGRKKLRAAGLLRARRTQ